MNNPRLAGRYAKSIFDLAVEQNKLEEVNNDMRYLHHVCAQSREFTAVLKSPVIAGSKKIKALEAVAGPHISPLTLLFLKLLVEKTREQNLEEITEAFAGQYNTLKHIYKVKLTTATPVSEDLKQSIIDKIKATKNLENIELETKIDESLIGGFQMQLGDTLVDASIRRDLLDIKKQFANNDYIHKIR